MEQKTILIWFRNDLRIHDNVIIHEAVRKNARVIPVYCFNPYFFSKTSIGTLKTGSFRTKFIFESVLTFKEKLKEIGSDLIVLFGNPEVEIIKIALHYEVNDIYVHQEVAFEENNEMQLVEKALWKHRIPLTAFIGHTLYHKQDLPFPIKDIPNVFTAFRKKIEKETSVRQEYPTPEKLSSPTIENRFDLPTFEQLGIIEPPSIPSNGLNLKGGEAAALARLKYYLWDGDHLKNYKSTRNGMIGSEYSTKLSPYLALGCISPRRIYFEVKKYETTRVSNDSTYWLIFELLWRDYFRFMFKKHGNRYFKVGGFKDKVFSFGEDQEVQFASWQQGTTGATFIDACMKELNATGFLSNRGRQNAASYLINDLKVNWTWGAMYFEEKLIDYSPSSNWGNWAYIAGVGNDPRENRYFNPLKQAKEYDPEAIYTQYWNNL
ncbi:MAG: DASH family cryptochrome [Bacteroidetes bacterium]|nr:DASH family cryptochrome [Bacteroidota bacterium]